jgi:hypothetical protein
MDEWLGAFRMTRLGSSAVAVADAPASIRKTQIQTRYSNICKPQRNMRAQIECFYANAEPFCLDVMADALLRSNRFVN